MIDDADLKPIASAIVTPSGAEPAATALSSEAKWSAAVHSGKRSNFPLRHTGRASLVMNLTTEA